MIYYLPIILLSFAGYFLHRKFKVSPVACVFLLLCTGVSFVWFLGGFNLLFEATVFFYSLCIILGLTQVILDIKKRNFTAIVNFFNVALVLFLISSFIILAIYAWQKPHYYYWDEYSFWGTAAKQVHSTHFLPFLQNFGLNIYSTLPTSSAVLSFLISVFNPQYNNYAHYYSYIVVILLTFALLCEFVANKLNSHIVAISVFLLCFVCGFFQTNHLSSPDFSSQSYAYATSLVDFLMVIYAVSCVFLYFLLKGSLLKYAYILPALPLCLVKDVGIIFALLAMCVIACFQLFIPKPKGLKFLLRFVPLIFSVIILAGVYSYYRDISFDILYGSTSKNITVTPATLQHNNSTININQNTETEVEAEIIIEQEPRPSLLQSIFSPSMRTQQQKEILNDMALQFTNTKTVFFIYDSVLVSILIIICILCIIFIDKKYKPPLIMALTGIVLGAILYIFVISYFMTTFADGMVEYPRYMSSYYWICIYLTIALVAKVLINKNKTYIITLFSALLTACIFIIGTNSTFIASPQNHYKQALEVKEEISPYNYLLNTSPKLLLVTDRYNDYTYMLDRFYLLPAYVNADYNFTGFDFSKSFSEPQYLTPENENYYIFATDEEFLQIAYENFDYIYISYLEEEFVKSYSEHFKPALEKDTMYEVIKGDNVYFEEVPIEN